MATVELSEGDRELLLESLRYTRERFETYAGYADEAQRRERVAAVDAVAAKLR